MHHLDIGDKSGEFSNVWGNLRRFGVAEDVIASLKAELVNKPIGANSTVNLSDGRTAVIIKRSKWDYQIIVG